jgi:coniferyl-aldehyde dehydrogenase
MQLALAPAVAALSAGNRVMIKPSEVTPRFSKLLADAVAARFSADECAVVTGGAELGQAFVTLPFDHLFFTGSTEVGRRVALAAAANLTPVTLELGGKSPAIVDTSSDMADAVRKIAAGKLFNAGQTCIAPDYVMVPAGRVEEFAVAYRTAARQLYPRIGGNPDYTSIVSERHHARLDRLLVDATAQGARVLPVHDAPAGAEAVGPRRMPPALLLDVSERMAIMQEEIFGPLLPVLPYDTLDEAIGRVNANARPLALYWFGKDKGHRERVLRETISGGVTVNDALLHIAQENLPFGGVGASGTGAYHGEWGFRLFSHQKPVFEQSALAGSALVRPPYGRMTAAVMRLLRQMA